LHAYVHCCSGVRQVDESSKFPDAARLARILSQASGEKVTEDQIRADIAAGAPCETDGGINIAFYVAWLLKHDRRGRS
jgi:hypothetical protein